MARKSNKPTTETTEATEEQVKVMTPEATEEQANTETTEADEEQTSTETSEATEEQTENVEKEGPEQKVDPVVDKLMKLYPHMKTMWITRDGFVHSENVPEHYRKNAKLYKNKYYQK